MSNEPIDTVRMEHDKTTKRKERYSAPDGARVTGSIYIRKEQFPNGYPPALDVTVSEVRHD